MNLTMRRKTLFCMGLLWIIFLVLVGCGGGNAENETFESVEPANEAEILEIREASQEDEATDVTQSSDEEENAEAVDNEDWRTMDLPINTIRLHVSDSKSEHVPDGVYIVEINANASTRANIAFLSSNPYDLVNKTSMYVVLFNHRMNEQTSTKKIVAEGFRLQYGNPPSGYTQLMSIEDIEYEMMYDAVEKAYRGSFTVQMGDGLTKPDPNKSATVKVEYYVEHADK